MAENLHPRFDNLLSRSENEKFLNQKACAFWFTGLSGSGKSTIAAGLQKRLFAEGFFVTVLDGDNVRSGINKDLGFSDEDRKENIRRIAELAKVLLNSGAVVFCSFVSPTNDIRSIAKSILKDDMHLIWINASLETCEKRDVKGLYKKARSGSIQNFTGIDAPFEIPKESFLKLDTDEHSIEDCVELAYKAFINKIRLA